MQYTVRIPIPVVVANIFVNEWDRNNEREKNDVKLMSKRFDVPNQIVHSFNPATSRCLYTIDDDLYAFILKFRSRKLQKYKHQITASSLSLVPPSPYLPSDRMEFLFQLAFCISFLFRTHNHCLYAINDEWKRQRNEERWRELEWLECLVTFLCNV